MTRFQELQRIEAAIEHRNCAELLWAAEYCQMRLAIASRKGHQNFWRNIQQKVKAALKSISKA